MNIEVGQGFVRRQKGKPEYNLIVGTDGDKIEFIQVLPAYTVVGGTLCRNICYDEPDAIEEKHKDNVRLESCPPPFSNFKTIKLTNGQSMSNSVAIADMGNVKSCSLGYFNTAHYKIIDGGAKVSEMDMNRVYNHPWASRNQRERVLADMAELNKDTDAHRTKLQKYWNADGERFLAELSLDRGIDIDNDYD